MGDESSDLIPHLPRVAPSRPSLPPHLGLLDKRVLGGFAAGIALWRGGRCVCSTPSSALDLPSLFSTDGMEEEEGPFRRNHQIPSLLTHSFGWGTGKGPGAGSAVLAESRGGTTGQAVPLGPGSQAGGLQQDSSGAESPWGLPVVQGQCQGGEGPSELSTEFLLFCLLRKRPSGSKFCLVSRCLLHEAAPACKTRAEQRGLRKSCP